MKFGRKGYHGLQRRMIQKRFFLSHEYRCEEAWNQRLQSSVLQNIKPSDMFFTLGQQYSAVGKISAVDIDIFANTVVNDDHVEEILSIIHTFRHTAEATNILDSTHHAVIRYLLAHNRVDDLLNILFDRLNNGIFPDHLCYNILMDEFINRNEYGCAAKVAVLPMLQEDGEHPITNALSAYSCHKYLENPSVWKKPEPIKEPKEEIKVRVDYVRNPYFDDHFDLVDPRDLVGKTLVFQGKNMNNVLGRTYQLRGLILYKKYEVASTLIQKWLTSVNGEIVYKEVFNLIKQDSSDMPEAEITDEFQKLQTQLDTLSGSKLCNDSLLTAIENDVKSAVEKQAVKDVSEQCKTYREWEKTRASVLKSQVKEIERLKRVEKIKEMKKDLEDRERVLTFFDNEEQIELQLEEQKLREQREEERVAKIPKSDTKLKKLTAEEDYIPPNV